MRQMSDVELLGSSSSQPLPLAGARVCYCCRFFGFGMGFLKVVRFPISALSPSGSGLAIYNSQYPPLNSSLTLSLSQASACSSRIVASEKSL
jgi:hypothetical protein